MSFFVTPNEDYLDLTTETMAGRAEFQDRYDAIKDLREADMHGLVPSVGEMARANGFFRVASLQGTLKDLAHVLNPEWLKEPKNFYRWLDKHPQHCAYDRRKFARPNQFTFSDGKPVL